MNSLNPENRRRQVRLALATQAQWESDRGFANHHSLEELEIAEDLPALEKLPIEGILATILDEFLELYEAIIHPEPKEAELLELADAAAFALRLYAELLKVRDERGATYSQAEFRQMTQLVSQAMLAGEVVEFANIERSMSEKDTILTDLRQLMTVVLKTYCHLVGIEIPEAELVAIVEDVGNIAGALLLEGGEITKLVRASLLQLMLRPIVQASPDGHATVVNPQASEEVMLDAYAAIEEFARKHYGYENLWLLVGSLYSPPVGKNVLNYPYPLPEGVDSYREFKLIRNHFPGRVIPLDYDVYRDTPQAYIRRWEFNHPGQSFTTDFMIQARIPNFDSIAAELR